MVEDASADLGSGPNAADMANHLAFRLYHQVIDVIRLLVAYGEYELRIESQPYSLTPAK